MQLRSIRFNRSNARYGARTNARSWVEIDCEAVRRNARAFRKLLNGARLIAVLKADAYGHGAVQTAQALRGLADMFAAANPSEALDLRAAGVREPILLLYPLLPEETEAALEAEAEITVDAPCQMERLQRTAAAAGAEARVHIALNTGLNRYGIDPPRLGALVEQARRAPNLRLAGASTHFAESPLPESRFTQRQTETFLDGLKPLRRKPPLVHAANTGAALNFPSSVLGGARIGIGLYGVYPHPKTRRAAPLQPALAWRSRIAQVVELEPGDSLSYFRSYAAEKRIRAAVIPVGYADGFRAADPGARVLTNGIDSRILGRVMMDAFAVDISECPDADVGTPVTLIGQDGQRCISAQEAAERAGTHPYDLLAGIHPRAPRAYADLNPTAAP